MTSARLRSATRSALRLSAAVAAAALLASGLGVSAAAPASAATGIAGQNIAFGASTPVPSGGDLMESVNLFEKQVTRRVDVVNTFKKWGGPSGTFASVRPELDAVSRDGRVPMVTWEPMPATGTTNAFPVERIAAGDFDAYVQSWADGMRDFAKPVHLRLMHEMNGNWYSWSGNPAAYVAAWRHVHDIFTQAGATNVVWDWVANADDVPTTNTLESYWPGADYVDVIGMDGYNCYWKWRSFEAIFKRAYTRLAALNPDLPIWVVETGSCEPTADVAESAGHTKAEWIRDAFASTAFPRLKALMFFNEVNPSGYDWRVNSSATALTELRTQLKAATGYVANPAAVQPPRPLAVTVTADGTGVGVVRWQAPTAYFVGYNLLVKAPTATTYAPAIVLDRAATEYRLTGLTSGATYKVVMQTYTAAAISLLSDAQYFTVPDQAVTTPRGLTASATQTRVSLKWTVVEDATSYQVFDGTGALLATTTTPAWTSGLFDPATAWSYYVVGARTTDAGTVTSLPSTRVAGVTTSATPTGVSVLMVDGKPTVTWTAVAGATGYRVVRDGVLAATVSPTLTSWVDPQAASGATYAYSVASYNTNSQSGRVAAVAVTVP